MELPCSRNGDKNLIMGIDYEQRSDEDIEATWSKEIERRLAEIDAGSVELIPWEEVRAELFRDQ
jgi:putative addiction module component (TIGR02574 family)